MTQDYTPEKGGDFSATLKWERPNAVQIYVSLNDIEPKIWRRLIVPLTMTLADLHYVLQAAMGWKDSHLHEFVIGGLR